MRKLAILAAIATSSCTSATPPSEAPVRGAGAYVCRPDNLKDFVGRPATQALGAEMQRASGARILQWVGHGMMVTMDFSPERLRVFLTADNRVERANCG